MVFILMERSVRSGIVFTLEERSVRSGMVIVCTRLPFTMRRISMVSAVNAITYGKAQTGKKRLYTSYTIYKRQKPRYFL